MTKWFYRMMGETVGPFSSSQLRQLVAEGVVTPDMHIKKGDSKWVTAAQVKGLFDRSHDSSAKTVSDADASLSPTQPQPPLLSKSRSGQRGYSKRKPDSVPLLDSPYPMRTAPLPKSEIDEQIRSQKPKANFWPVVAIILALPLAWVLVSSDYTGDMAVNVFAFAFMFCIGLAGGLIIRAIVMAGTSENPERFWPVMLFTAGVIAGGYFLLFFDNTVSTESGRVHNTGQMQFQMMGFIGSIAVILVGVLLMVFAKPKTDAGD